VKTNLWIVTDGHHVFTQDNLFYAAKRPMIVGDEILIREDHGVNWYVLVPHEPINGENLRELLLNYSLEDQQYLSAAAEVANWYKDHSYCPRCGHRTRRLNTELAMVCDKCRYRSYPRLSPCVIVLVEHGDQILLAHHHRSNKPVYTVLAGFVEVGESAEQAVVREVKEEAGVHVNNIRYLGSQSWPFPGQMMLAYLASYESGELNPDKGELSDLRWFKKDELPILPPLGTISESMISQWLTSR
jgi:NAD+ diphosphatase